MYSPSGISVNWVNLNCHALLNSGLLQKIGATAKNSSGFSD